MIYQTHKSVATADHVTSLKLCLLGANNDLKDAQVDNFRAYISSDGREPYNLEDEREIKRLLRSARQNLESLEMQFESINK